MVKAGQSYLQEKEYTLSFGGADFNVTEKIGSPWTVVLTNDFYKTITLDFGKFVLITLWEVLTYLDNRQSREHNNFLF